MIDFERSLSALAAVGLKPYVSAFRYGIESCFERRNHGDLPIWLTALAALPDLRARTVLCRSNRIAIGDANEIDASLQATIYESLRRLMPWRKGPFDFFGIAIDAEWRSDWKWQRVAPHIDALAGRKVLDIGCGNGYYLWRMRGEEVHFALGIDPSPLCLVQFMAAQHFIADTRIEFLPLRDDALPCAMQCFDTTFSMGVIYHHREPLKHLTRLYDTLRTGGQLVLESLVIDGETGQILQPRERYAQMRNVWLIPSVKTLVQWLIDAGFGQIEVVDVRTTSTLEQRATDWMQFHSLGDFLDPENSTLTVEGYPAPKRAVLIARKLL